MDDIKYTKVDLGKNSYILLFDLPKYHRITTSAYNRLIGLAPEEKQTLVVNGKTYTPERKIKTFGRQYKFSGFKDECHKIEDEYLKKLMEFVNSHYQKFFEDSKHEYNQLLVNWYMDGNAQIGPHSDDEKQLVNGSPIYSVSFGATRDFVVKSKTTPYRREIKVHSNQVLVMCGEMQKHFTHSVPIRKGVKTSRINCTFRMFK